MITYFVLKDEDGRAAGSVRLENGKARSTCPCRQFHSSKEHP